MRLLAGLVDARAELAHEALDSGLPRGGGLAFFDRADKGGADDDAVGVRRGGAGLLARVDPEADDDREAQRFAERGRRAPRRPARRPRPTR